MSLDHEHHTPMGGRATVRGGQLWRVVFTVPGSPGVGSLNRKHTIIYVGKRCHVCKRGTPKIAPGKDAKAWKSTAAMLARNAAATCPADGRMMPHAVAVALTLYWPRVHRKPSHLEGLPYGDVDACEKLTLDALTEAGILYDDGQVTELHVRERHDPERPRVAVSVQRID